MNLNTVEFVVSLFSLFAALVAIRLLLKAARAERRNWDQRREYRHYGPYGSYEAYMDRLLVELEDRVGIRLTPGAREMLVIPIFEARAQGRFPRFDPPFEFRGEEIESLEVILRTMSVEPSRYDREGRTRSSLSVIRALWKNFCHIPPFCDGRGEG